MTPEKGADMTRLTAHLVRGATAATLLAWALMFAPMQPAVSLVASVMAVIAMRGCPACWMLELWDTLRHR